MNDITTDSLDQTDEDNEDILTYTVSDEALEAAAQAPGGPSSNPPVCSFPHCS